jgi:DNA-binding beta-propeller fold protein YncE
MMRRMRIIWPLLAALVCPGAAIAAPGDPYVVYTANNFADGAVILRTNPRAGSLVEISRNGPQGTLFARPYDLALEADGDLVVADMGTPCTTDLPRCDDDGRIIRVDPLTGRQTLLASGAPLLDPAGIAVAPDGQIYVADNFAADDDGAVVRIDPVSGAKTVITQGEDLDLPFGILVDRDGSLVVSNRVEPGGSCTAAPGSLVRVQLADGDQQVIATGGLFRYPLGVALDAKGRIVFANECGPNGLVRLGASGIHGLITPNSDIDVLVTPERMALDPAGDFLVTDYSLAGDGGLVRVEAVTGAQSMLRQGDLFNHPLGVASVVNRPPRAALRLHPRAVAAGKPVRLDAGRTVDPDGQRLIYEWDLNGDGAFETGSGTAAEVSRSWSRDGPVTVGVRVNDPHGGVSVARRLLAVDGSVPILTGLRSSAAVIAPPPRLGAAAPSAGPPRAARIRFRISEAATVLVSVERAVAGRRAGKGRPCRRRATRGRRCVRFVPARLIRKPADAGANKLRIRARGLRAGSYRLVFHAFDAVGNAAAERTLGLRVVRFPR